MRRFLILMAVLATLAPLSARAADKLFVRLEWFTNANHLPLFLAVERGWFKAADLDVSFEDGNGSTTAVQLVATNSSYDLGMASLAPMATGRAAGMSIISIAGYINNDIGVLVPQSSPWKSPNDLKGKHVLYTSASFEGPFVTAFFTTNHIPLSDLSLVNVSPNVKISQYVAGEGDAAVSSVPYFLPLVVGKRDSKGILFADYGIPLPNFGLIASPAKLKEHGPAIKRFVSIVGASWEYILAGHLDEAVKATLKNRPSSPVPAEALVTTAEAYRNYFGTPATKGQFIGMQSAADWAATIKVMEQVKVIPPGSKPEQYFTNDYLDAAYGRKIVAGR